MSTILFVVNVDWFFISHRLPIAQELVTRGHCVHVLCGDSGRLSEIEKHGIHVHRLPVSRGGVNILIDLNTIRVIFQILKIVNPHIVHAITVKPVLYAGLVARIIGIRRYVVSVSGLGYIFTDNSIKAKWLRKLVALLYQVALTHPDTKVIFQNPDDAEVICKLVDLKPEQVVLIRGSGVDLSKYTVRHANNSVPVVVFLARYLIDKGIREFVVAATKAKEAGCIARYAIAGAIDCDNPNSISKSELELWKLSGVIEDLGFVSDVPSMLSESDIVVLPSYREGFPKALIEAAASGKPVITTDVPGCRDAIRPNVTGILVPPKDPDALARAIDRLLEDPYLRVQMGEEGRRLAEKAFSIEKVIERHIEIYGL